MHFTNASASWILSLQPIEGTGFPCMLARVVKVSYRSRVKILTPKQMHQRLPKEAK